MIRVEGANVSQGRIFYRWHGVNEHNEQGRSKTTMAWITGEKDGAVVAANTRPDCSIGYLEQLQAVAKNTLNNVSLWAVPPRYDNPFFLNLYNETGRIDILDIADFENLVAMPQQKGEGER
jgi:hypothetical protein